MPAKTRKRSKFNARNHHMIEDVSESTLHLRLARHGGAGPIRGG